MAERKVVSFAAQQEAAERRAVESPGVGLCCPKCGCRHFLTAETTRHAGGFIVRRRQCRACGHRITTREQAISSR